ncbi:mechanosensitive ion channel family protein [Mucilaginibacter sp. AK015]|uniref:mechanosensitive ion channel family protein n=1 Tax=Mucilaginibacter sp. AK015 TaxID=2723072 RepID=UPI00161A01C3|nr:mechanosensitive ion channel domain-containing protein [Mucilaginibacter sp. AK015]MBB5394757.1 small-conductance mechanosensitive channel [Mucilaginibacter sp. AK015]
MEKQINIWAKQLPPWLWNLAIIAFVLLIGFIIKVFIKLLLNYYKNKKEAEYSFFRSLVTHLSRPLNHFIPLFVANILLPFVALKDAYDNDVRRWLGIALLVSFASILMNAIKVLEDYVYYKYDFNKTDNLRERKVRTQLQFIRKVSTVLIIVITLSLILLSFDGVRKLGAGLLTGVGIGGIIIGFAAQKSLGNLLAGFQIAFTQPIRIDDVLVVEGEWGRVEEITLTYVVLNIWDQRRLILPINYFIEKPFQNWTRTTSELLGTVFLYVDYNVPAEPLRAELTRLLNETPLWDKRLGILQVTDVKETTVEVRMLVSAHNSSKAFDLRCYIRENMLKYLQENYPSSLPRIRVTTENNNGQDDFPPVKLQE